MKFLIQMQFFGQDIYANLNSVTLLLLDINRKVLGFFFFPSTFFQCHIKLQNARVMKFDAEMSQIDIRAKIVSQS